MNKYLLGFLLSAIFSLTACQSNAPEASSKTTPAADSSSSAATINSNANPSTPTKNVAKIVAFGDSLTAGYGLQPQQSYPALLQQRLKADGYDYEVVNAGISGDTSAGGVRRIDWSLEGDVKFLILELGANDILRMQSVEEMKKNLSNIIKRAKAKGATVLLAGMESPTNAGTDYRKAVHEAFTDLASKYQVTLIPFFLEGVAGIESLNQADQVHPNPEGTKIVADTVYKYLRPLLEKEKLSAGK
jgi:acyl-CoA thioesterase-1